MHITIHNIGKGINQPFTATLETDFGGFSAFGETELEARAELDLKMTAFIRKLQDVAQENLTQIFSL